MHPELLALLRLTLTDGLGPKRIARLLQTHGSAQAVLSLSSEQLRRTDTIGPRSADAIARSMRDSADKARQELELAHRLGVHFLAKSDPGYPPLLREIPDAPPLLSCRGTLHPGDLDRYTVAIVGSRRCSQYGLEQAGRFASVLATAGLTIVSGGARGIDTAAHRAALQAGGRTIAVLGCGLANAFPPENAELFEFIGSSDAQGRSRGCVVSELPLNASPQAENFPARNRIISGLSLGVLVIEAAQRSGALITARQAIDEHNREVFALPGRVDSPASQGTLELLKAGSAHLVTEPGDVIAALEIAARHTHAGTHEVRYGPLFATEQPASTTDQDAQHLGAHTAATTPPALQPGDPAAPSTPGLPHAGAILAALSSEQTLDQLLVSTGLAPAELRGQLTMLEIQRKVRRVGSHFQRVTNAKG